jgi:Fe-S-cluster-containing hydrogenase component 2
MNVTCDKCIDEEEPLCVKYCMYGALQISNKNANKQEVKDND